MGGRHIGPWLRRWAAESPGAIVEVGAWLGAGTAQLALGALISKQPLHVYDRWRVRLTEVSKARDAGISLGLNEDILPRVRKTLAPFNADISFHQGTVQHATWPGTPIGLYVDDAAKRAKSFAAVRRIFWPALMPGAIIVLMDYRYYETAGPGYRAQADYMEPRGMSFELIADRLEGTPAAAFRYRGPA